MKPDIVFYYAICYNWIRTLVRMGMKGVRNMISVIKRDGEVADFNLGKITNAIKKAFKATKNDYNQ